MRPASSNTGSTPPRSRFLLMVSPWQRSEDLAEETVNPARRKVGETLLQSLLICRCPYEHCHHQSYPHLSPWISYSEEQNVQLPTAVVGGQSRPRTLTRVPGSVPRNHFSANPPTVAYSNHRSPRCSLSTVEDLTRNLCELVSANANEHQSLRPL